MKAARCEDRSLFFAAFALADLASVDFAFSACSTPRLPVSSAAAARLLMILIFIIVLSFFLFIKTANRYL